MRQREPKAHRRPQACGSGPQLKGIPHSHPRARPWGWGPTLPPSGLHPQERASWGHCSQGLTPTGTQEDPRAPGGRTPTGKGPEALPQGSCTARGRAAAGGTGEEPHFQSPLPLQNSAKIYRKKRDDLCGSILTGRGPRGTFWNAGNLLDLELGDGYMSGR